MTIPLARLQATPHETRRVTSQADDDATPGGHNRLARTLNSSRVAFFEYQPDSRGEIGGHSGTLRWLGAHFGIVGPDIPPDLDQLLHAVLAEDRRIVEDVLGLTAPGHAASGEFRVRGTHGQMRYLYGESYTEPMPPDGTPIIFGTIHDVTNQRQYEADLAEIVGRNRMLLAVIDACPISVTVADAVKPGMPLTYVNHSFCQMTGYEPDEVIGRPCRFLQGPESEPGPLADIHDALHRGVSAAVRVTNYRKDGTTFLNQLVLAPIHSDVGDLVAYLGLQSDVTLEAKRNAAEHQRQKIEVLGRMMGGMAHEINNLLQPIMLLGQEILDQKLVRGTGVTHLELLLDCGKRARQIIGQLLAFSRPSARRTETVDGGVLLTETLRLLRQVVPPTLNFPLRIASPPPHLIVDRTAFTQILLNLVSNAAAAMDGRGELVLVLDRVPVSSTSKHSFDADGSCARLRVMDTGQGMDRATLDRVFEPFFTTKPVGQGTGLGLSVVYGLVHEMGGSIALESAPLRGTTVTILFSHDSGAMDYGVNPDH